MTTITCKNCGTENELTEALTSDIKKTVLATELAAARKEAIAQAKLEAQTDIDIAKKQFEAESAAQVKKAAAEQAILIQTLRGEVTSEKESSQQLRTQLSELMEELREERKARANADLEAQKKIAAEEAKIREEAMKDASEKSRLEIAERDKQLEAARKVQVELERKLNQKSQQMQGEILELDLETAFSSEFRDDEVTPVEKGVKGADIKQLVKSTHGTECGVILWEVKRTKAWSDAWVTKLKDDLRATKANVPVIISDNLPKGLDCDIHYYKGVWVCKPRAAVALATLLRRGLLEVAREKAISKHRGTAADALYNYVTSHEFVQPIEAMVEVYMEMKADVTRERAAFSKLWEKREIQADKLLTNTATIIGGMQGQLGTGAVMRIKGLDLLEAGDI